MAEIEPIDRIGNGVSALDGVLDLVCSIPGDLHIVSSGDLHALLQLVRDELRAGLDGLHP